VSARGDARDPGSFDLPAQGPVASPADARAVLCLHGLTATPYEVRPVAEALAARGFRSLGPLLPGHGTRPEDLARVTWQAWLAAARAAHAELAARHARIFVVGTSMGGLLALALASELPIAGLATIGTPLELRVPPDPLLALVQRLRPFLPKRGGPDIRDPAARARHPTYSVMPVASVRQLVELQRFVKQRLSRVTAPILVAHGAHDRTADPADQARLLSGVASQHKERLLLGDSGHIATVDFGGPELARRIAEFFDAAG